MIDVFSYNRTQNKIKKSTLKQSSKEYSWIRVVNPDEKILKEIAENTTIPLEELQENLEEEERPKVSTKKYLEIIYRAPYVVDKELETLPVYFYLLNEKLITIEKKPLKLIDTIADKLNKNKSKFLFKRGLPYFIHFVIDKINDDFLERIDRIASRIDLYENFSKRQMSVEDLEKVYDQSVTLSFFNQALIANVEVLNLLKKGYFKLIPRKDNVLFEELYYDVLQILDTEKIQREVISNLINVHSVLTSTRLNEFMKKLTIIAIIITIPTLMSGIYGMNFKYIPLAENPYGFYITTLFIGIITFVIYYLFTRKT